MERTGFILKVKKEKLSEYKLHHQRVWPEMLEALRRNGWSNYSIFQQKMGHYLVMLRLPKIFSLV